MLLIGVCADIADPLQRIGFQNPIAKRISLNAKALAALTVL